MPEDHGRRAHPGPERLADRIAIEELLTRYALALDRGDWEALDRCFTEDARVDYTASGGRRGRYTELRAWLQQVVASFPLIRHYVSNFEIEIEGDEARSRCYLLNPMGAPGRSGKLDVFVVCATYRDRLVRTGAGWRIRERFEEDVFVVSGVEGRFTPTPSRSASPQRSLPHRRGSG